MTTSALITMLTAWFFITFLMLRFLIKVIKTPQEKDSEEKQSYSVHLCRHLTLNPPRQHQAPARGTSKPLQPRAALLHQTDDD